MPFHLLGLPAASESLTLPEANNIMLTAKAILELQLLHIID